MSNHSAFKLCRSTISPIPPGARADVIAEWEPVLPCPYVLLGLSVIDASPSGPGLRVERIREKNASFVVVQIANDALADRGGSLEIVALLGDVGRRDE